MKKTSLGRSSVLPFILALLLGAAGWLSAGPYFAPNDWTIRNWGTSGASIVGQLEAAFAAIAYPWTSPVNLAAESTTYTGLWSQQWYDDGGIVPAVRVLVGGSAVTSDSNVVLTLYRQRGATLRTIADDGNYVLLNHCTPGTWYDVPIKTAFRYFSPGDVILAGVEADTNLSTTQGVVIGGVAFRQSPTPSPTNTPTNTPTRTPTRTPTQTPTPTATPAP